MDSSAILKEIQTVIKEGYLQKESRFLRSWRKRWVVLTNNLILTYKERRVYESPTEVVSLKQVMAIKSAEEDTERKNTFKIETGQANFYLMAETGAEKEAWIGVIGKAMVKISNKGSD